MREPIKVGDLVKFKHHIFDEHQPAWLVIEAWESREQKAKDTEIGRDSQCIKVHGINAMNGRPKTQRASNFIVISRAA